MGTQAVCITMNKKKKKNRKDNDGGSSSFVASLFGRDNSGVGKQFISLCLETIKTRLI